MAVVAAMDALTVDAPEIRSRAEIKRRTMEIVELASHLTPGGNRGQNHFEKEWQASYQIMMTTIMEADAELAAAEEIKAGFAA